MFLSIIRNKCSGIYCAIYQWKTDEAELGQFMQTADRGRSVIKPFPYPLLFSIHRVLTSENAR